MRIFASSNVATEMKMKKLLLFRKTHLLLTTKKKNEKIMVKYNVIPKKNPINKPTAAVLHRKLRFILLFYKKKLK